MGGTFKNRKHKQPAPPPEMWVTRDRGSEYALLWAEEPALRPSGHEGRVVWDGPIGAVISAYPMPDLPTDRPLRYRLVEEEQMPKVESVPLFYMAHPVGVEPQRADNLRRALRWFRWLVDTYPDMGFTAPWLPYCQVLEETPKNRERGIRDDLVALRRCDGIVLCGGHVSAGMQAELDEARKAGMVLRSALRFGREPPMTSLVEPLDEVLA